MARPQVPLETALSQLLTETRIGQEKAAARGVVNRAPAGDPVAAGLRKVASMLRTTPEPGVTYEDLNRVKEMLYGRR